MNDEYRITSPDALSALYREPSPVVRAKKRPVIDPSAARFVASSTFCLLATADEHGSCDVSPRGGPRGFIRVLDEHTLALPDLSGNNLLDSVRNIVITGRAGLLVVIPGQDETMRVDGRASITTDPEILALWDDELRTPKVAVVVEVESVFIHCAKAFRRGLVWQPDAWEALADGAPDVCEVYLEGVGVDLDPAIMRADLEQGYAEGLAEERRV